MEIFYFGINKYETKARGFKFKKLIKILWEGRDSSKYVEYII